MARHNWQLIHDEYVTAPDEASRPSLEQLASKYKCSPSYLREKAAKEGWTIEAERFLQTVTSKRQEQKSTALAGELADWDAKCFKAAQGALAQVFTHIKLAHQSVEHGGKPIAVDDLDRLSRSLERLQKIGKASLGEEEVKHIKIDYANLSDDQLQRLAAGEDPRYVVAA